MIPAPRLWGWFVVDRERPSRPRRPRARVFTFCRSHGAAVSATEIQQVVEMTASADCRSRERLATSSRRSPSPPGASASTAGGCLASARPRSCGVGRARPGLERSRPQRASALAKASCATLREPRPPSGDRQLEHCRALPLIRSAKDGRAHTRSSHTLPVLDGGAGDRWLSGPHPLRGMLGVPRMVVPGEGP